MKVKTLLGLLLLAAILSAWAARRPPPVAAYRCEKGKISFKSEALLEVIQARSRQLRGAISPAENTFAWSVEVRSFEGFNGPLQREHFNENYLESQRYPRASFVGKIIEKIDFQKDGLYAVRAKGKLSIHGTEQERIIKSSLEVKNGALIVRSTFTVPLADHNISIPKIVHQKIAAEIEVTVEATLSAG
jgi:polyisoprenoid-binding protein YceI